jgi:hypothetical protein
MELVLPSGIDKTTTPQKVVAGFIGLVGLWLIVSIMPPLTVLLGSLVGLAILAVLAAVVAWVIFNPWVVWGVLKTISWEVTKGFIHLAPMAAYERYLDWVRLKGEIAKSGRKELGVSLRDINAQLTAREQAYDANLRALDAADRAGKKAAADLANDKMQADKSFVATLTPTRDLIQTRVEVLDQAIEVYGQMEQKLDYRVQALRAQYDALTSARKGMAAAHGALVDAGGLKAVIAETEKALSHDLNKMTEDIAEFEKGLQPFIEGGQLELTAAREEGQRVLAAFRAKQQL